MGLHSPRNPTSTEANSSTSGGHDGSGNRGPAPPGLTGVDAADAAVLALRQAVAAGLLLLSAQVRELVEAFTVSFACFGWQPPFCRCFCRDVVRLHEQSWPGCSFRYMSKSGGTIGGVCAWQSGVQDHALRTRQAYYPQKVGVGSVVALCALRWH